MIKQISSFWVLILALSPLAQAAGESGASLTVRVEQVQDRKGEVGIAVFQNKKGFPTHIEHAYEPAWIALEKGIVSVEHTFEGLPAGDWAVSVLHDENGNRKMERSTLGFPEEGVGFSNDQKVKMSAPDFDDCKFPLTEGETKQITIQLDYRKN